MNEKTINISGRNVTFRCSAAMPRMYRVKFGRDIMQDFEALAESYGRRMKGKKDLAVGDLEIFENVASIMAYHADHSIPESIDEWLEQFDMFSIYEILPQILELWNSNLVSLAEPGKKTDAPQEQ